MAAMGSDDRYLRDRNHDVAVEVMSWAEFGRVAPLMDELGKHFGDIRTRRIFPRPMTGATTTPDWDFVASVIITVTALGGIEYVRNFIGLLAQDNYRALRAKLLKHRARRRTLRRVKRGVVIRIGQHRFVFDQSIKDAEFRRQLEAAQRVMDASLTAFLKEDDPNDDWIPWLWDKSRERWRTSGVRLASAVGEEPSESRRPD